MSPIPGWPEIQSEWLDTDHRLLTSLDGWTPHRRREGNRVWRRSMPGDANDLFLWQSPLINAPAATVDDVLVNRLLDYHQHWTKEFRGGRVVERLGPNAQIIYQHFDPGVPGISKRDLCSVVVTRKLDGGALLASHRSVDTVPPQPGYVRIDWWGAHLCVPGEREGTCALFYLDRENQGRLFPAFVMNLVMPNYLRFQYKQIEAFFANGGPATT
jgi:hypothetical protein